MSIWNDLSWVEGIRTPFFNFFFYNVSLTGYPIFLFLFIAFGYFFWSPQRFSRVAMLLFISAVINSFLKDLFQDPRPPADFMLDEGTGTSYGWPSGHAQIAVTLWGLLAYELKNKLLVNIKNRLINNFELKLGEITRVVSDENFINQLTKCNLGRNLISNFFDNAFLTR